MANNPCPTNVEKENIEKRKEELRTIFEKQSDRVNHLQTSAFTLANYYFVFQGVIVGGIAKVRCSDRWFFISLSLIAAILNLFSLIVIGGNYKRSLTHLDDTIRERDQLQSTQAKQNYSHNSDRRSENSAKIQVISECEPSTSAPTQHQEATSQDPRSLQQASELRPTTSVPRQHQQVASQDPESSWSAHVDKYKKLLRGIYFQICIGLFVSFAIIVLVGCWTIPCRKAHPSDKCIRLCEGTKCISICT
ncbi:hypothetical protein CerSpe_050510 [Prunus speciosa]